MNGRKCPRFSSEWKSGSRRRRFAFGMIAVFVENAQEGGGVEVSSMSQGKRLRVGGYRAVHSTHRMLYIDTLYTIIIKYPDPPISGIPTIPHDRGLTERTAQ